MSDLNPLSLSDPSLLKHRCYINGQWRDADSRETLPVHNPATHEVLAHIPNAGGTETAHAIANAHAALAAWRSLTAAERALCLKRWHTLMLEHRHDLARIMTLEQGKPLTEALGEINYAASFI